MLRRTPVRDRGVPTTPVVECNRATAPSERRSFLSARRARTSASRTKTPSRRCRGNDAATHAANDAVRGKLALVVLARVRASVVRVTEQSDVKATPAHGHVDHVQREVAIVDALTAHPTTKRENRSMIAAR